MITRLTRDERGAIALMAVFMAIFLVAAVAYVQGVGAAVLHREQMQDAADAAVFSSAVLHARGMNVLALLNMLMAALLAVLVALKLVEMIATIAIVAISVIAFIAPGAAAAIPPLGQVRAGVIEAHASLSPGIHTALEAMQVAATGVRTLVPVASQVGVLDIVASQPDTPAQLGFAVPMRATLPTEDGTFAELCGRAGDYVGKLTYWVFDKLPVPDVIADIVSSATGDLVRGGGDWFCGAGGSAPPRTTVKHEYTYPELLARSRCKAIRPERSGYEGAEHATVCEEAEQAESASKPDGRGHCVGSSPAGGKQLDCNSPEHPYHERAWLARRDCSPEADEADRTKLRDFDYQERRFTRTYRFEKGRWRVASTQADELEGSSWRRFKKMPLRPCSRRSAPIDSTWNDGRGADSDPDADAGTTELPPVCTDARPPTHDGREGQLRELHHREVTRVFGCGKTEKHKYEVEKSDGGKPANSKKEVPQRLIRGATLGAELFQIRGGVIGRLPSDGPTRLMRLAAWSHEPRALALAVPEQLGRIAVAQAEYYFDGPEHADPASYLWSMQWRARLRRFSWPGDAGDASVDAGAAATFSAGAVEVSLDSACALALAAAGADDAEDACRLLREGAAGIVH